MRDGPTHSPAQRRDRLRSLALIAFPLALFIVGCLYFGGDLGKSTDDYSVNMRIPESGALPSPFNPYQRYPYFWRPLHIVMIYTGGTLFADHWRPVILFCAAVHALAAWLLFSLLRNAARSSVPAACGALVFLLHPMVYEVAFWFCSICTALATALFLALALLLIRIARAPHPPSLRTVALFVLTAFAVPCFYEQPASGFAALPFIALAAILSRPDDESAPSSAPPAPRGWSMQARLLVSTLLLPAAAAGTGFLYILLMRASVPATAAGGSSTYLDPARLLERVAEVARGAWWGLVGGRFQAVAAGAFQTGRDVLSTPSAAALLMVLAALGVAWAFAAAQRSRPSPQHPHSTTDPLLPRLTRAAWLLAAAALVAFAYLPHLMLERQNVEARNAYFPLLGIALTITLSLDALLSLRLPRAARAFFAPTLLAAFAALLIAMAVALVGLQHQIRSQHHEDLGEARQLLAAVPNPPPDAVFYPLRLDHTPTRTGRLLFDRLRPAALATPWSAVALLKHTYRRSDIKSAGFNPWAPRSLDHFTTDGARSIQRLHHTFAPHPEGGSWLPWDRAIPFIVDSEGVVRLVRAIRVTTAPPTTPGRAPLEIHPPIITAILNQPNPPPSIDVTLIDPAPPPPE